MSSSKPKIILAVQTQYSGHQSRGLYYYQHLKDRYDIEVITVGRPPAAWFVEALGSEPEQVPGLWMAEDSKGKIAQWKTAGLFFYTRPRIFTSRRALRKKMIKNPPALVISDFEPEVSGVALKLGLPVLGIDAHRRILLKNCPRPNRSLKQIWDVFCMHTGISFMMHRATRNIAISFFEFAIDPGTESDYVMCPPLLRPRVYQQKVSSGDHLLIYHNTGTEKADIIEQCRMIPTIVYGYNCAETVGMIQFKKNSASEFISDLASCRAYASRAGFESVAEALYFGKPCYLVPQAGQYEQAFNAFHASKFGAVVAKRFDYQAALEIPQTNSKKLDANWLSQAPQIILAEIEAMLNPAKK